MRIAGWFPRHPSMPYKIDSPYLLLQGLRLDGTTHPIRSCSEGRDHSTDLGLALDLSDAPVRNRPSGRGAQPIQALGIPVALLIGSYRESRRRSALCDLGPVEPEPFPAYSPEVDAEMLRARQPLRSGSG